MQPGPGGGGQQLDVGVRQDLVVAERGWVPVGRDDRHTLGAQAAALDVGAVDAQQGGGGDAEQTAEGLGLPADRLQGAVQAVAVVPDQSVAALVNLAAPLFTVDHEHPGGADDQVDAPMAVKRRWLGGVP